MKDFYTEEAYQWFQRLQFKNLLARFETKMTENDIETVFRVIQKKSEPQMCWKRQRWQRL